MILALTEYRTRELARDELPDEVAKRLDRDYGGKIEIEPPSFRTNYAWRLTPGGWVGFIPLGDDFAVSISPKVPIANLFRMLEYAYSLESFKFLDGLFESGTLDDLYERLAGVLASLVLERGRRGFYRTYVADRDTLPFVRGRIDVASRIRSPWAVATLCHFEEHTADVEENRILAWTLHTIARGRVCTERTSGRVRRAYREVAGLAGVEPVASRACVGRLYDRLNDDYRPMHALCRFFLECSGPHHDAGDRTMLPFLVDMARLFEQFVAAWMARHLDERWELRAQENVVISRDAGLSFDVDLVLYDRASNTPRAVLDTKYKRPDAPGSHDVQQIIAYAVAKNCHHALLVYPTPLARPLDETLDFGGERVHVRSVVFDLAGDLDAAGRTMLEKIGL